MNQAPIHRRKFTSNLLLASAATLLPSAHSWAATYPSKLIKVVVPFSTGGGTDVVGRSLIQSMSVDLGQSMIIDNRPGAGTVIGSDFVAKAGSDGHTLLLTTSAIIFVSGLAIHVIERNIEAPPA